MTDSLKQLCTRQKIRPLDYQFAKLLFDVESDLWTALAAAQVSFSLSRGSTCLNLEQLSSGNLFDLDSHQSRILREEANSSLPTAIHTVSALCNHLLSQKTVTDGSSVAPLVLSGECPSGECPSGECPSGECPSGECPSGECPSGECPSREYRSKLYLYRYWLHECRLAEKLSTSNTTPLADPQKVREMLDRLIPESTDLNWQKVAAALAVTQPLVIISGGPGTGKTTTVARMLALLIESSLVEGTAPTIHLVAPTGKASARLTESIGTAVASLNCNESVRSQVPRKAGTIHRLLGVLPGENRFRHNSDNRLHLDILVVDEASMIDLPLMAQLTEALPDHARLILLGDRDQLTSVDAGSVFGDLCSAASGGYSQSQVDRLQQLTGYDLRHCSNKKATAINDRFCHLKRSYRFDANSGIGTLARAVNSGDIEKTLAVWDGRFSDIFLRNLSHPYTELINMATKGYSHYLQALTTPFNQREKACLQQFNRFRILCLNRDGPLGVEGLNQTIRFALARQGLIAADGLWYAGRPVMISRNAYDLELYNGDIGIAIPDDHGQLKVLFEMPDGTVKHLLPSRLPEHQTVFAMTVHKSQGSEFEHTVLVLPEGKGPGLTRELVYTGVTRARLRLDLFSSQETLAFAVANRTRRSSGLAERLQNSSNSSGKTEI